MIVLLGISLITFILLQVVPGDPVALMLEHRADEATIARVRHELGLDVSLPQQYINFLNGIIHFDFGTSYFTKEAVSVALVRAFKVTVRLALCSFAFAVVFGVTCGMIAAIKHDSWIDSTLMLISIGGVSAPSFWVAILLQIFIGLKLDLAPVSGFSILPVIALGTRYAGSIARITRTSMLDVIKQDPGGMLALLTVSHVVVQIQMVAVCGQGNDIACLPLIYQRPNNLIGVGAFRIFLAFCGQL